MLVLRVGALPVWTLTRAGGRSRRVHRDPGRHRCTPWASCPAVARPPQRRGQRHLRLRGRRPAGPCRPRGKRLRLGEGTHTFSVAAVDSSGVADASPATETVTVPIDDGRLVRKGSWKRVQTPRRSAVTTPVRATRVPSWSRRSAVSGGWRSSRALVAARAQCSWARSGSGRSRARAATAPSRCTMWRGSTTRGAASSGSWPLATSSGAGGGHPTRTGPLSRHPGGLSRHVRGLSRHPAHQEPAYVRTRWQLGQPGWQLNPREWRLNGPCGRGRRSWRARGRRGSACGSVRSAGSPRHTRPRGRTPGTARG